MVFGYLISIFKLLQSIAVRICFNSPVANNQPLYILLLARQHCWLPTININVPALLATKYRFIYIYMYIYKPFLIPIGYLAGDKICTQPAQLQQTTSISQNHCT